MITLLKGIYKTSDFGIIGQGRSYRELLPKKITPLKLGLICNGQSYRCGLLLLMTVFATFACAAQNAAARYEIDAKRIGVTTSDQDALPRSREFIRLDSTYYVGYFYEGMFKYDRAADYMGYHNCIQPLRKALLLYEKDFKGYLKNLTTLLDYNEKFSDIQRISNALYDSYSNVEQADSAMWVLEKVKSWNAPLDFMEYHIKAAWTIHRNRYYLHKYSFLQNSVQENENLALSHLYEAKAEGNPSANFYLAIIYNYLQNIDSTEYYYNYLLTNGGISLNNYAHYKNTLGQFAEAINNFEREKFAFDKRLIESYYFLPTLYINSGNALEGIRQTSEIISQNGSTPGFGWYNIALARSYLYDGQLDSCEKAIRKASQFKELHLGTTLGQVQYDFAVNVVKMMLVNQQIQRVKFFNSGWWYSFTDLLKISELMGEKFLLRYAIVNQFANNPERQNVIYTLFSSENVISFDEIYNVIKDISPAYFTKMYKQKIEEEKRTNVKRYMQLFYANFNYNDGNVKESIQTLEDILYNTLLDTAHEKLFLARVSETLAKGYYDTHERTKYNDMLMFYLREFPELLPYSGLHLNVRFTQTGLDDDITRKVVKQLRGCNIQLVNGDDPSLINVVVGFEKKKDKYIVSYSSTDNSGRIICKGSRIIFKKADGIGKELALRMFGVSGPEEL